MEKLELLELIEVEQTAERTVFTFLDRDRGEVRDITWNTKKYDKDNNKWIASPEQEEKVEEWSQEYFNCSYADLANLVVQEIRRDIYGYDTFNSFWEVNQVNKFSPEDKGQIFSTTVTDVAEEVSGLKIKFMYEDKEYQSNMGWAKFVEGTGWFGDPVKKEKQKAKFETKFGIPFKDKDQLIGKDIMVEIDAAFGKPYADIKAFPKKKK